MEKPANKSLSIKRDNIFRDVNHKSEISKIIDSIAHPFAAGTFYYFIHQTTQAHFHFVSESLKTVLGYDREDFTPEFLFEILHPEDKEKIGDKESISLSFLEKQISDEDVTNYKVAFLIRLKHANGDYITVLHQVRPIAISEDGEVLETVSIHTDISYLNPSVDHKISFQSKHKGSHLALDTSKNQLLTNNCVIKNFSSRELEIIKCAGLGMNIHETADKLFVSPNTVTTHKKNILRKSGCKNFTELVSRCIKEGVI